MTDVFSNGVSALRADFDQRLPKAHLGRRMHTLRTPVERLFLSNTLAAKKFAIHGASILSSGPIRTGRSGLLLCDILSHVVGQV